MPGHSFDLVLFGGSGDLAMRNVLPALYFRFRDGEIAPDARILASARQDSSADEFRAVVRERSRENVDRAHFDQADCEAFLRLVDYVPVRGA